MKKKNDLFDELVQCASVLSNFALLGGEADEFARFIQLEFESYEQDEVSKEQKSLFYIYLNEYKRCRYLKRNWRDDFSGRDFSTLIV